MGVVRGEGNCKMVRSGRDPVLLETGMCIWPSCSPEGQILKQREKNMLRHENNVFLPMRKQRRRSAVQCIADHISPFVFAK